VQFVANIPVVKDSTIYRGATRLETALWLAEFQSCERVAWNEKALPRLLRYPGMATRA